MEGLAALRGDVRARRRVQAQAASLLALVLLAPAAGSQDLAGASLHRSRDLEASLAVLRQEKAARSPAERKLSSQLLQAARARRGLAAVPGLPGLRSGVEIDADGSVLVDLRARVGAQLLAAIEAAGGRVLASQPQSGAVRARLPLAVLSELAARGDVRAIRPALRPSLYKQNTSRGDVAHHADLARAAFGADGAGVAVGVLSDGVDSLAARQASGDLPPGVTILPGQGGSGDEGTAMLEIVHDLAPAAQLLFATAFTGQASFAANVLALRAAGADVIVDDIRYPSEAVFQDDDVAQAVEAVSADGALYVASAGNFGNLDDATSGVWEGPFRASGTPFGGDPSHDFAGGVFANPIVEDSPWVFTLQWNDPLGASGNDYDLVLFDASGSQVVAVANDLQNGDDDPFEMIDSGSYDDTGRTLAVVLDSGTVRVLHLDLQGGRLGLATAGQLSGHAGARSALAVTAVDARQAGGAGGRFDGSEEVQDYGSDGPRRVFFAADGTPLTPGDLSQSGGQLRAKPDLAGADCVATATPGYRTFCGSSAAASHVAGLGALLLSVGLPHGATAASVRQALVATALDLEAPGWDRDAGAGVADALAAADRLHPFDCDDGLDNDGDGYVDVSSDPGCRDALFPFEDPQCQDGVANDGDGLLDFDGGASLLGAPLTAPDPQCTAPWRREASCGIGFEIAILMGFARLRLAARRARRALRVAWE